MRNLGPTSPVERVCERSLSITSVISASTMTAVPPELDNLELGEGGVLDPVYSSLIETWFSMGLTQKVPSMRLHTFSVLAPLTIPLIIKAFISIVTPDTCVKIFSKTKNEKDGGDVYSPCHASSLCPKQADPDRRILNTMFILIGRNFTQWKESLNGEINVLENSLLALRMQKNYQRFVSYVKDAVSPENKSIGSTEVEKNDDSVASPLIPRQRLLWITVRDRQWLMHMYNFNKDSCESLSKQCDILIQWHNARWALLSSIVAQKLGLFHNQPCSARKHAHETLKNNAFIAIGELDSLVKQHGPPQQRDYNAANARKSAALLHTAYLEVFRDSKPTRLLSQAPYGHQWDLLFRHGHQWLEKRHSEHREGMQRLLVLWQHPSGSNISVTEDVIQLFKLVARIIHYCFTPLLFLPKWRLQVARTRDPNMGSVVNSLGQQESSSSRMRHPSGNSLHSGDTVMGTNRSCSPNSSPPRQPRRPTDDHWHQSLCSAYLQEYVQYVHSLGFLQLEIKPMTAKTKGPKSALKTPRTPGEMEEQHQRGRRLSMPLRAHGNHSGVGTSHSETNVLYFHKSHQGDDAL